MNKPHIVVIIGPTASGKSAYAVRLAKRIRGEIISADSRQVYKGLDIGSGKITKKEMRGIPHHLLDVVSPQKVFTAHDFVKYGRQAMETIVARGKTPIICGGTGFYIDALLGRITLSDVPPNQKLRNKLRTKTASQLFTLLKKKDPERAKTIDAKNPVRLIRAIEIAQSLGSVPRAKEPPFPYPVKWIGLKPNDTILRKKIHTRLTQRIREGMVREAQTLHKHGLSYARMRTLGLEYRHLADFLQKKVSKATMTTALENDIWRFAKRQMTYWKRNANIRWIGGPTRNRT